MEKVLIWVSLYMRVKDVSAIMRLKVIDGTISAIIMLHRYHSFHGRQSTILNLEVEFSYLIIFSIQGNNTEILWSLYREGNRDLKFIWSNWCNCVFGEFTSTEITWFPQYIMLHICTQCYIFCCRAPAQCDFFLIFMNIITFKMYYINENNNNGKTMLFLFQAIILSRVGCITRDK
jgi:hypothetical protein